MTPAVLLLTVSLIISQSHETANSFIPYVSFFVLLFFWQVTPTVYTQEMLQSTEERFANNKEITLPRVLELLDMSKSSQHKVNLVCNVYLGQH